jgi:hypothetical protein
MSIEECRSSSFIAPSPAMRIESRLMPSDTRIESIHIDLPKSMMVLPRGSRTMMFVT